MATPAQKVQLLLATTHGDIGAAYERFCKGSNDEAGLLLAIALVVALVFGGALYAGPGGNLGMALSFAICVFFGLLCLWPKDSHKAMELEFVRLLTVQAQQTSKT